MMEINPNRPLLTFALVAYNQEQYVAEAVRGALSQTYSPLQVILSDDCSPDGTFEVMQEVVSHYQGPHQVILRRNERNMGLGGHINRVVELAQGELIVIAAGDDISLPQRSERIWQAYLDSGKKAYSIFSNEYLIDDDGVKRALEMQEPPNPERLTLAWFTQRQSSVTGSIHEPLVLRRYTGNNLSLGALTREDLKIDIPQFRRTTLRHARNFLAVYETRLQDIEKLLSLFPERKGELAGIKATSEIKLRRVQAEVTFWQASNPVKLKMLFFYFLRYGFRSTALRLSLAWLFPSPYIRWFHHRWVNRLGKLSS
jgi:glycosyltransferase involved in cell wall biosynthesis